MGPDPSSIHWGLELSYNKKQSRVQLSLTLDQCKYLKLALDICRSDYETDCDLGISYARKTILRISEIENKLIKALNKKAEL